MQGWATLPAMATSTVEDYAKVIYHLQRESPAGEATVARIAATLGVTRGSVSSMVKKLRDASLADSQRYGGVRLTAKGESLAIDMIRRHRLIEVFLVETLGFDWAEVHEEAERLEHALSNRVLDRLDAFLGHPTTDPHGDPIPDSDGNLPKEVLTPLSKLAKGDRGVVGRIADQDPRFLEFAASHGLRPGAGVVVAEVTPEAESIRVRAEKKQPASLSLGCAGKIYIRLQ